MVLLASAVGFTFVTPAATVWGAQRAEGYERPGLAYAAVFGVRLAGFLAAAAFPPLLFVSELVAAPMVAAAVASTGRPIARSQAPRDLPDEPAREVPGGERSPPARSRCPDAAFALR